MGGNAFTEAGTIHRAEITPTLRSISSAIGINITDNVLGSTGKKEYSGDIDIVLDLPIEEQHAFFNKLKKLYGENGNVRKLSSIVSALIPINNYNESQNQRQPRTGFVQVDFMYGDPAWNKFYFHSPSEEESQFKGTHRNIALSSICRWLHTIESTEVDEYDRPIETIRWKWSPKDGLCRVKRTSRINKTTGKYILKQDEELLGVLIKDPRDITTMIFNDSVQPSQLGTLESIIGLVKNPLYFDQTLAAKVFKTMADNFSQHYVLKQGTYNYPNEIAQYLKPDK